MSPLVPAETILAIQSAVAAHGGTLQDMSLTNGDFSLPPAVDLLELKRVFPGVFEPTGELQRMFRVFFHVEIFAPSTGAEVRLAATQGPPPQMRTKGRSSPSSRHCKAQWRRFRAAAARQTCPLLRRNR